VGPICYEIVLNLHTTLTPAPKALGILDPKVYYAKKIT